MSQGATEPPLSAMGVLGPLQRGDLGVVLPSEQLVASLRGLSLGAGRLSSQPLSMANLGSVRHSPLSSEANLDLSDSAEAADELSSMESRSAGAVTVVEATPIGCGRDLAALCAICSRLRRVRIVASTGYGSERSGLPGWLRAADEQAIALSMVLELTEGVELSPRLEGQPAVVRAGAITIGVSSTVTELECRLLRSAAIASRRTLAPIFVHLPLFERPGDELVPRVLAELEGAGAALGRTCLVVGGLSLSCRHQMLCGLSRGAYVCLGTLGMPDVWLPATRSAAGDEGSDDGAARPTRLPHDDEICGILLELLSAGFCAQLLLGTGVRLRLQRERYGGGGYGHCADFFVPLLRASGIGAEALAALTEHNAAHLLCWWRPPPAPGRSIVCWKCAWCASEYEGPLHAHERLPSDRAYYEKFDNRYCSTACLSHHRETGFKPRVA